MGRQQKQRPLLSDLVWSAAGMGVGTLLLGYMAMHVKHWPVVGRWHQQVMQHTCEWLSHMSDQRCTFSVAHTCVQVEAINSEATHTNRDICPWHRGLTNKVCSASIGVWRQMPVCSTPGKTMHLSNAVELDASLHTSVAPAQIVAHEGVLVCYMLQGLNLVLGSFGTVMILLFGRPEADAVRIWPLLAGQLGATAIAVSVLQLMGASVQSRAVAMAATMVYMLWTDCIHPPGGEWEIHLRVA